MAKSSSRTTQSKRTRSPVQTDKRHTPEPLRVLWRQLSLRRRNFMASRPHRSFRRTQRRDYARRLQLPGYIAFTSSVLLQLKRQWKTFGLLAVLYIILVIILGGITDQSTYTQISALLTDSSKDIFTGGFGQIGQAGLLALSSFASGSQNLSADQQIYLAISLLFAWLTTVWLLREYLLGKKPKLRDGLYSAGSPAFATLLVVGILILQMLPLAVVALVYAGLVSVGILDGGFGNMLFWVFALSVALLVLYWATSTFFALVIVTLPGMYPLRAMRAASDLVMGRRLRILYRLLWLIGTVIVGWAVVVIPAILIDTAVTSWLPGLQSVPFVPYIAACMTGLTVVWCAAYVYLLYRKVVDDGAAPA